MYKWQDENGQWHFSQTPPAVDNTGKKVRANHYQTMSIKPGPLAEMDRAAAMIIDKTRLRPEQRCEYGGWILHINGRYVADTNVVSSQNSPGSIRIPPPPRDAVASWHTHPSRPTDGMLTDFHLFEYFSPASRTNGRVSGDIPSANWDFKNRGIRYLYLGTPAGRIRRFDAQTQQPLTVRGTKLKFRPDVPEDRER